MRFLILILLLTPLAGHAELYRWTDEQGQVHFGDKPPDDKPADSMDMPTARELGSDQETRSRQQRIQRQMQVNEERAQQQRAEQRKRKQQRAREMARPCRDARTRLRRMNGRIVFRKEDGSVEDVTMDELARRKKETRQWIEKNCKGIGE